jgi:hypothetical protein
LLPVLPQVHCNLKKKQLDSALRDEFLTIIYEIIRMKLKIFYIMIAISTL